MLGHVAKKIILFSSNSDGRLPAWFKNFDWGIQLELHSSNFLPDDLGLLNFPAKEFNVKIWRNKGFDGMPALGTTLSRANRML